MNVQATRDNITRQLGVLETLESQRDEMARKIVRGTKYLEFFDTAQVALADVIRETQSEFLGSLSELTTLCLRSVFDKEMTFHIDLVEQSGRMLVDMYVEQDGRREDPMTAHGGGVVDVIAFALRVSCLLLVKNRVDPVLMLDEPFRFVSKDLQGRVGQMIVDLSERLGVQFVIVTHEDELRDVLEEHATIVGIG